MQQPRDKPIKPLTTISPKSNKISVSPVKPIPLR
jgi:hypothetical protein